MEILKPVRIKKIEFRNRVVLAPLFLFGYQDKGGIMGEGRLKHYLVWARSGIGLVISQALFVTGEGASPGDAGVYSEAHIGYLRTIADACHAGGSKFFAQLSYPDFDIRRGDSLGRLSEGDMLRIRDDFIRAARFCKAAGCDGIELHGAHGFFLNMVASSIANTREDAYGGGLNGRLHLVKQIVEEIRGFAGEGFIVSYRMGWGESAEADIKTAQALEDIGVEMLHVSSGIPVDRQLGIAGEAEFNEVVNTGIRVKAAVEIPVIAVNDIGTFNRGESLVAKGLCDFVAYGRPFLADPDFLPTSILDPGYRPCLGCSTCGWFRDGEHCPGLKKIEAKRRAASPAP